MNAVTKKELSCDKVPLDVLVHAEEDSAEFKAAADHVESCAHCRDRLGSMAGSAEDWAEVQDVLRQHELELAPYACSQKTRNESWLSVEERRKTPLERLKLDFLSPPSHPEMLGRLGRYEVEQLVGAGGMGIVLKGFDAELNRPVAIKVLAPHLAHSGAARQRFAREARAAAAVVHEHVVAIHNVETVDEVPFLVMQYVRGRSLQERVDQDGPLEVTEVLRIGMQAAAGLAAAHAQGVIHRDIKPANILLENGVERALLTDFGLARAAEDASLTRSGVITGTPHYMSPEQARAEAVDARADLFSLGAVLYFMATGHPPFRAEQAMAVLHRICHGHHRPVWEVNPQIPDELSDVIDRLLQKKPSRRFATAEDVQRALARVLSQVQQPGSWRARHWLRRVRRHRRMVSAVAGIIALVALTVCLVAWFRPPKPESGHVETTAHTTNLQERAAELRQRVETVDFGSEVAAIHQALANIAYGPPPETIFIQAAGDAWLTELRAAGAAITHREKSWPDGPYDSSFPKKVKGEQR